MQTLLTTSSTSSLSSSLIWWTVLRLLVLARLCFQACPLVSGPAPHLRLHHQRPLWQGQQPPPWSRCPSCSRSARSPHSRQRSLAIRQIRPCHFPSYVSSSFPRCSWGLGSRPRSGPCLLPLPYPPSQSNCTGISRFPGQAKPFPSSKHPC